MRERDEHERELRRAHREIASLRERVAQLERALDQARGALVLVPARGGGPVRKLAGSSPSGEPVYAD